MNLNVLEPLQKSIEVTMMYDNSRVETVCPVCGEKDFEQLDIIRKPITDSHLCICKKCGFITYNPQLKDLNRYYANQPRPQSIDFLNTKAVKLEKHKKMIGKYLQDKDIFPKSVFDYGCSDGYFLKYMRDTFNSDVEGIELNPGHANWGITIEGLDIKKKDDLSIFGNEEFDLISCYHVLEHLQNPQNQLKEFHRMLSKDGLLYIGLPTIDRIDYPTIEHLFKEDHINMFSRGSLEYFLNTQGFEVVYQNTYLYGTAVICKKILRGDAFSKSFYNEHKELLKKIYDYYQYKKQSEELMARDIQGAKQAVAQALQVFDNAPEMIIKFASLNDTIDEQDILEEYIKRKPEMYELLITKGISHFKDQDMDNAEKCFLAAIDICGNMPMCLNHLGQIAYHRKDYANAVKYMQMNLEMEPHNLSTFEMLANFLMLY